MFFIGIAFGEEGCRNNRGVIHPEIRARKIRIWKSAVVRYNERMKTLTITEGRGRLGYWLKKAARGEDIGFMFEGKVVALRPVEVISADYALQEYGLTGEEMAAAEKRIHAGLRKARTRGEITPFTGSKNDFR